MGCFEKLFDNIISGSINFCQTKGTRFFNKVQIVQLRLLKLRYIYISIHREDSFFSTLKSYLDLNFDVLHAATNNGYIDGNDIRLVNLGQIALFSNYKLTTSSEKHLEDISYAHIVSLMYKLQTCAKETDDLSIGLDRSRDRKQRELNNSELQKGKYHFRNRLKDIFGFDEHQKRLHTV